ncbi:arabinogalactan protein 1-like [Dioscorea cayenensis subsp. rotundata]|uniref:Arabinogalactan protein 1-like n=1 Tax=Dioscorea cayennensis subsp. rotundata TaxID=55577 RepID=A0AB40CP03_DIOCR|nr:arabinogalactan protein 1-like [Dioscorea cayenensis subsp. rotundata]
MARLFAIAALLLALSASITAQGPAAAPHSSAPTSSATISTPTSSPPPPFHHTHPQGLPHSRPSHSHSVTAPAPAPTKDDSAAPAEVPGIHRPRQRCPASAPSLDDAADAHLTLPPPPLTTRVPPP